MGTLTQWRPTETEEFVTEPAAASLARQCVQWWEDDWLMLGIVLLIFALALVLAPYYEQPAEPAKEVELVPFEGSTKVGGEGFAPKEEVGFNDPANSIWRRVFPLEPLED